jgi:acyl-CoA hydrolase
VKTKVTKEGYTEEKVTCARAYFCFVAINMEGVPVVVPELLVESDDEIKNYNIGQEIRKRQLLEEKRFEIELEQNL